MGGGKEPPEPQPKAPVQPPPVTIAKPMGSPEPLPVGTPQPELGNLYDQLLECVKQLFASARAGQAVTLEEAIQVLARLPKPGVEQSETALSLIERHTPENYLYSHSVNVALLAHHFGHQLGYADSLVQQLVLAGLLHDLGMAGQVEELVQRAKSLSEEEWRVVSAHPANAVKQLKDAQGLSKQALESIIGTHYQREKGRGYPPGLQDSLVMEFSKILAVCDTYDALTHARTYRKRFSPAQAIKMLIDGVVDEFDRRVVKVLVESLSLYPRGSTIRLSTNELGIVERVHAEAPLRPVVQVTHDANNVPLLTPKQLDLSEPPFVYVKEIVTEQDQRHEHDS